MIHSRAVPYWVWKRWPSCGLTGLTIVLVGRDARAQAVPAPADPAAPPTAPPAQPVRTPSVEPQLEPATWWLGGSMDLLMSGSIDQAMMGTGTTIETNTTVGFGGLLDYMPSPLVSIGFAPRVLIGLRPD